MDEIDIRIREDFNLLRKQYRKDGFEAARNGECFAVRLFLKRKEIEIKAHLIMINEEPEFFNHPTLSPNAAQEDWIAAKIAAFEAKR